MELLTSLVARNGFLPHGVCFSWAPGLLWTMVGADLAIAAAYFSIPMAILSFVRQRGQETNRALAWLFSAFIFACGITHVLDVWTIWQPDYAIQVVGKVITAVISVVTAIILWPLIPKALKLPTVQQLQGVIGQLEAEVRKRRSAEEYLLDLEQSLAATLASIDAGFLATDRQGRVTRMNAVAERITGWTQGEAQGRLAWQVLLREGQEAAFALGNPVDQMLAQAVKMEDPQLFRAVARDGTRVAVELKLALTRADDGSVRGAAMIIRDMTATQRAEAERGRLASLVESSSDAIIAKSLDGRITDWNGAAQAMFGYSAAEAIGQPVQMLIPPDREAEEMRILADLAHGKTVPAFDTERRAKDGRVVQVSVTISPIRNGQGRVIGGSKIARDVTPQRRAEAALRESEQRLRFALESAQIGEWGMDLATGEFRRSLRHDRCFGHDRLQARWNFDALLAQVLPDDRAEVARSFDAAVSSGRDWHVQCRVLWPDGSLHWLSLHGSLPREPGRPPRMIGIVSDITAMRQAEQARLQTLRLEAENRQIQEATRLKSQFLANMSHELRTPLNAIIGFADLLHSGAVAPESPRHRVFLGHIGTSGRHLLRLINDLLDLSKVESGKFEFVPEPVDLAQLVQELAAVLQPEMQRKRLGLAVAIDASLTDLRLDPARLKQVLYNYLSNAIKFTGEGGRIALRALPQADDMVRIEVEDNGIGIAPHDLHRLFGEFQQLDAGYSKRHQGTGLGLALTRRLVQAQGGSVGVHSEPGAGSVFYLLLPRVYAPNGGATVFGGSPLLVIEDDESLRARLSDGLMQAGFSVDVAASALQAVERARGRAYGGITLDLMLPDQAGLNALALMRGGGASRRSPVLALTMPGETGGNASFAIANVLSKPLRTDEVVAAMATVRRDAAARPTVMVIDDDAMALDLMAATLREIDIAPVCLDGGRIALQSLDQHRPDAIILDLMMPGIDGFTVLAELRRRPDWQHTPVFIWTSMILTDEEYASLARSAQAIVGKGGGEIAQMMDALRRWRPHGAVLPEGGDR